MAFLIAHRAGNDLARLRQAETLGFDLVEADLRLWRGRVEIRHLKTLGPIPLLWDRWALANPLAPRLLLDQLLDAVDQRSELLLDLKGRDPTLSTLVLEELSGRQRPSGRRTPVTICARSWHLLEPFAGLPGIRTVYSVGTTRELRRLRRRFSGGRLAGVSIHERLLDAATLADLHRLTTLVVTWPVNSPKRARELIALGVDGLISDALTPARLPSA
jgi:glycerophosphoryl diester phosphodiesterase